ncbi:unnamed protein product [Microthlaspi erraticum]|uniref:RNase H type-1 domain-containing protein n=1 Tax=Microthlaspi erraticum TaxID=1685480 RepID=A0A6D2IPV8_9BRAS|nr:unnamed protein product [Microthlaspi erraticum]
MSFFSDAVRNGAYEDGTSSKFYTTRRMVPNRWVVEGHKMSSGISLVYFDPGSGLTLVGASKLRRGLYPLQIELEALVLAMQSMLVHNKRQMNFQTDCSDLVKIMSKPDEWRSEFSLKMEKCRRKFQAFSLTHIPMKRKHEDGQVSTKCSRSAL